jgi:integrase
VAVGIFDAFIRDQEADGPQLAGEPAQVRALMLDFLGHLRATKASRGPRKGQPLSLASVQRLAGDVEQFYLSMADNQDTAAAALGEPGWLHLGPEHTRFYRRGELPGRQCPDLERDVIDEAALSQIMAGLGLLGAPVAEGGFGDEQAMRITMLEALLGRRINEICLLDRDPMLPLARSCPVGQPDPLAPVAQLRYQQTKIDGAPDTVPVHAEVVAIVRAQQEWADRYFTEHGAPGKTPKYLFLGASMNRNGDRPYPAGSLRPLLSELALRLDVRDSTGRLVDFNRTHRFRHTVATSLLNAGVAIHVVQRYLGHLSPTMTMHYAKTLQSTAEAEFLRYRKLNACAHDVDIDPKDLYDLLQLDKRTDRVLPNGYCLLAPRQVCGKGNACLVCDKLATDATFLPELKTQQQATVQLIEQRQAAFLAAGAPMQEERVAGRTPPGTRRPGGHHHLDREGPGQPGLTAGGPRRRHDHPHRRGHPPERRPMTQTRPGNPANLKAAATRRHAAAVTRAEQGLDIVIRSGEQITFRRVAATAGVSLEFLYNHPPLRSRIEHLRAQQQTSTAPAGRSTDAPTGGSSTVVATLTAQLAELRTRHRNETAQLRQALEAAHGENLLLRRLARPTTCATPGTGPDVAGTGNVPTMQPGRGPVGADRG